MEILKDLYQHKNVHPNVHPNAHPTLFNYFIKWLKNTSWENFIL